MEQDTICALATATGGAIAVIRVSGTDAIRLISQMLRSKRPLTEAAANTLTYGHIISTKGEVVDEVLVAVYRAPHSYTGEDSVEIMCHGSAYIVRCVLQQLVEAGARQAEPGEYTQRAFLNGKMDLSQAEAVADLIASTNAATHHMAMSQLRGGFSSELHQLRDKLLHVTSLLELELDFSEEEVEFADRQQLMDLTHQIDDVILRLIQSFQVGNALKTGVPVAIIGETNVGKSTLLNTLLHEDRAIVSDIHGTTRDVIEDSVQIEGVTFRFIDTAGIRHTDDPIESMGIQRSYEKMDSAQLVVWVMDANSNWSEEMQKCDDILQRCKDKKVLVLLNKCDKMEDGNPSAQIQHEATPQGWDVLYVSAKEGLHIASLQQWLLQAAQLPEVSENDVIVTSIRHEEALSKAHASMQRVMDGLAQNLPGDLVSEDLRQVLGYLAEITGGAIEADDVLGSIFKNFCIGK